MVKTEGGKATERAVVLGVNNNNDRFNINDNINNHRPAREWKELFVDLQRLSYCYGMKTYTSLWKKLYNTHNLIAAYHNAVLHKERNPKVHNFSEKWLLHLCILLRELRTKTYKPIPLRKFVLRDPKTRIICVSDIRDRIVHHALVNILQPIFEPCFIEDSFASRKGKGTLAALRRFDHFKRKASRNNTRRCFVLKADIQHYFETVDQEILLQIIGRKVKDENIIWLIKQILQNYESDVPGKGMPLGNWTSQFFANVYLNELDQFVKHTLEAKYYLRYVDDFVILHHSKIVLREFQQKIDEYLQQELKLKLHPDKCKIIPLDQGVPFLGFKIFYHHKLVRRRNLRKIQARLEDLLLAYKEGAVSAYDMLEVLQGWTAYAMHGNTYQLRNKLNKSVEQKMVEINAAGMA